MKDQKNFNELIKKLQPLEENQEGMLKGGFASVSAETETEKEWNGIACKDETNTNCAGANCVAGCGG
jgi:hypothetical protein